MSMATIEPRLISIHNDPALGLPFSPSLELDPLLDPNIPNPYGRPFLLEPDARSYYENWTTPSNSQQTPSNGKSHSDMAQSSAPTSNRALRMTSPQSFHGILADYTSSKRGLMVEVDNEDLVQLPQLPKRQKAAKRNARLPPMIMGLMEPPAQAALFPPIATSPFHDSYGRNCLNTIPISSNGVGGPPKNRGMAKPAETSVAPQRSQKEIKPRKKWTDDETNNLMRGARKHGVGCWSSILEDPAFVFNGRTATDLRDRFRTCGPLELLGDNISSRATTHDSADDSSKAAPPRSNSNLLMENILNHDDDDETSHDATAAKPKNVRTPRRSWEALSELGIEPHFSRSSRRARTSFTVDEDHDILYGYQYYGPNWTKIQREPRFRLKGRKPMDLRNRCRKRFPNFFRDEDQSLAMPPITFSTEALTYAQPTQGTEDQQSPTVPTNRAPPLTRESLMTSSLIQDTLRIGRMLSSDQQPTMHMPSPQAIGPTARFLSVTEAPTTKTENNLPFGQPSNLVLSTAPALTTMGVMDLSRILQDDSWVENSSDSGGLADHSTIGLSLNHLVRSAEPPIAPSFYSFPSRDPEGLHEPPST